MAATTLRLNVNTRSAVKLASLVSNSVILAANAFLVGSGLRQQLQSRRRERLVGNLQLAAEVATAAATLTKVITETVESHRDPGG